MVFVFLIFITSTRKDLLLMWKTIREFGLDVNNFIATENTS
jgi:hypothetical protein